MAWIRSKKVRSKKGGYYTYNQVVRSYRQDGKHRQEVLCHLGKHDTLDAAIAEKYEALKDPASTASFYRERAEHLQKHLLSGKFDDILGGKIPEEAEACAMQREADEEWEGTDAHISEGNWKRVDEVKRKCEMIRSILDYYNAMYKTVQAEQAAYRVQTGLDKLEAIQHKYFDD